MTRNIDDYAEADLAGDPEARLEYLVAANVCEINEDDTVSTTEQFEETREIYADTYMQVSEEEFEETVADVFEFELPEAQEQIERESVTRHELVTFLSLQSFLERSHTPEILALLAGMVAEIK